MRDDAAARPERDRHGAVALLVGPHASGSGYVVLALVEQADDPGTDLGEEWLVGQVPVGAFARPRILTHACGHDDLDQAVADFADRTLTQVEASALTRLVTEARRVLV